MTFDGFENIAGLSLGVLLIGIFMKLLLWFVGELRSQVSAAHKREDHSESKADMLQDKFADEAAARARLEVEVQFLSSSLKAAQSREAALAREVEKLREELREVRALLDRSTPS